MSRGIGEYLQDGRNESVLRQIAGGIEQTNALLQLLVERLDWQNQALLAQNEMLRHALNGRQRPGQP